jgi:hypothetical protein
VRSPKSPFLGPHHPQPWSIGFASREAKEVLCVQSQGTMVKKCHFIYVFIVPSITIVKRTQEEKEGEKIKP